MTSRADMPYYPSASGGDSASGLARMLEELRWTVGSATDEMRRIDHGWVMRSHSLDKVCALNQVCFTEAVEFDEAIALADEYMPGMPFRHIVVEDEPAGVELEGPFRSNGWAVERTVLMQLSNPPDPVVDEGDFTELSEEEMVVVMKLWALEEHVGILPERLEQLMEYNRLVGRLWDERCFGVLDSEGHPVSITKLRKHEGVTWVEDVYTVPDSRGRGHARMLVTYAATLGRSAGSELTFIIADDEDWPKDLYARLGFERVGTTRTFRLHPTSRSE
jgi:GNAT superfamily N-acetyltransferase